MSNGSDEPEPVEGSQPTRRRRPRSTAEREPNDRPARTERSRSTDTREPTDAPGLTGEPEPPGAPEPTDAHASAEAPDVAPTRDGRMAVVVTTVCCAIFAGGGHLTLLIAAQGDDGVPIPWQPVVGASLALVAVVSFGGFFYASLRARVAIAASFVLTFLLILTYAMTLTQLDAWESDSLADAMLDDFRVIVQTIIAFYFGTETVITMTKIIKIPSSLGSSAITRSDRDLPSGSRAAGDEPSLWGRLRERRARTGDRAKAKG
jgi:hypothetical protein